MARSIGLLVVTLLMVVASAAPAKEKAGTREEAVAIVEKGAALLRDAGPARLIEAVNAREKGFRDRDLYLFVLGPDQKIVAHAFDKGRIGLSASELYDGDGQPYGKLFLKLANDKGQWVEYRIHNPMTGRVAKKSTFVKRVGDYILGCGYYE